VRGDDIDLPSDADGAFQRQRHALRFATSGYGEDAKSVASVHSDSRVANQLGNAVRAARGVGESLPSHNAPHSADHDALRAYRKAVMAWWDPRARPVRLGYLKPAKMHRRCDASAMPPARARSHSCRRKHLRTLYQASIARRTSRSIVVVRTCDTQIQRQLEGRIVWPRTGGIVMMRPHASCRNSKPFNR